MDIINIFNIGLIMTFYLEFASPSVDVRHHQVSFLQTTCCYGYLPCKNKTDIKCPDFLFEPSENTNAVVGFTVALGPRVRACRT